MNSLPSTFTTRIGKRTKKRTLIVINRIKKILKGKELIESEIAKKVRLPRGYVRYLLYIMLNEGMVERYWIGQWVYKLRR